MEDKPKPFQISLLKAMILVPFAAALVYFHYMMLQDFFAYGFIFFIDAVLLAGSGVRGVLALRKTKTWPQFFGLTFCCGICGYGFVLCLIALKVCWAGRIN
jgi:hypothetical protein